MPTDQWEGWPKPGTKERRNLDDLYWRKVPGEVRPTAPDEHWLVYIGAMGQGQFADYREDPPTMVLTFAQRWRQWREWWGESLEARKKRGKLQKKQLVHFDFIDEMPPAVVYYGGFR